MTQTTPPTEKRRNYPGLISLGCGVICFISGMVFAAYETRFNESLFTDETASYIGGIFGLLWFLFSALGLVCWFISLFLILPIWRIRFRATGAILGLLLPLLSQSFVLPTQGLAHYVIYYRVSDPAAIQYIQDISKSTEKFDRQFFKDTYEQSYSEPQPKTSQSTERSATIIVKYELRHNVKDTNLPKSFSVIIDRKTKKTEIVSQEDEQL